MFLELFATFAIGLAIAGIAMLLNRLIGNNLPRWITPASAGAAMILFVIYSEYSWFARTSASLPTGIEIAHSVKDKAIYRPWTYLWPYTNRFIAVDHHSLKKNKNFPDQRIIDLLVYGRYAPATRIRAVFDCDQGRRADLVEGVTFKEDGSLTSATWHQTGLSDPVTKTACKAV